METFQQQLCSINKENYTKIPKHLYDMGLVLKRQVAIIEDHDVPKQFWIL